MELGRKLKFHRTVRSMTVRELARKASCSNSLISQIEQNRVSPSIRTTERICQALEVTLPDFLRIEPQIDRPIKISPRKQECEVAMEWSRAKMYRLLRSELTSTFTALLLRLEKNGFTPVRRAPSSIKDFCVVLQGTVICCVGTEEYLLEPGETLLFDAIFPHQWFNHGEQVAEVLFTSPVAFQLFETVEKDLRWREHFRKTKRKMRRHGGPSSSADPSR